ncbi:MAG: hypothetical protein ACHQHP_01580 [Bacteroidia bacterium]
MFEYIKKTSGLADLPAIVMLKNGRKKNGIVLDFAEELYALTDEIRFVCNTKFDSYKETENPRFVETFPRSEINSIDMMLK